MNRTSIALGSLLLFSCGSSSGGVAQSVTLSSTAASSGKIAPKSQSAVTLVATGELVDFEGIAPGTILSSVFGNAGSGPILVSGSNPDLGAANAALIFDSTNPTGGDTDLGAPHNNFGGPGFGIGGKLGSPFENNRALGNIIIVAEDLVDANSDGLVDDPDDADVEGAALSFDFNALGSVTIHNITIFDVEENEDPAAVEFFDQGGASLGVVALPVVGDNGVSIFPVGDVSGVVSMIVSLNGSGAIDEIDFSVEGSIGDTVFCDLDDDGVQDPGEPGIPGVLVELVCAGPDGSIGTADDLLDSQNTDANGNYLFTGLLAGDCDVSVDPNSAPADKVLGQCANPQRVNLGAGEAFLDADFCFVTVAQIGDKVFCDLNNNGVQDAGDPGIPGVTVNLSCAGADGVLGSADDYTDSQVTDANGCYLFANLTPDLCLVTVDPSTAPAGKVPGICADRYMIDLGPDDFFLDADFCFITPGEIGDLVFCDIDLDGVQDAGEPGIQGATVDLQCAGPDATFGTADDTFDSTTTDANGNYLFSAVAPGDCIVSVDVSTVGGGKLPGACPTSLDVSLASGASFLDADFCFSLPPGTVGDLVFCDLDGDGVLDAGEPGIADVRVDLTCAGIDGVLDTADDFQASTTTDASGMYLFSGVPAGLCRADLDILSGPDGKVVGNCPTSVSLTLAPGGDFLDADFCFAPAPLGMIGDTVYCDLNDDGVQDNGEPGVPGVTIDLRCAGPDGIFGTADDTTDSRVTDANGMYAFTSVAPGLCRVRIDLNSIPADKELGQCPMNVSIDLQAGQSFLDADFCVVNRPGEIGDLVFCDLDNDGVLDPGEPGITGAVVNLTCAGPDGIFGTADDILDSTTTDANGNYLFSGISTPSDCRVDLDTTSVADKIVGRCPTSVDVSLQPAESFLDADFCLVTPGEIGDLVYCDLNDDGVQDSGEPGLADVIVELTCAGADGVIGTSDDLLASATTDAFGFYLFSDVPPGLCEVQVDVNSAPSNKAPGQCPTLVGIDLAPDQSFLDADFCFVSLSGGEGCTPGYWKQTQHFFAWTAPYTPSTPFAAVFVDAFPGKTLLEVMQSGGGGLTALGRHTVAALLNAASPNTSYDLTTSEVIMMFNDVLSGSASDISDLKDLFEDFNQQGCPLGNGK